MISKKFFPVFALASLLLALALYFFYPGKPPLPARGSASAAQPQKEDDELPAAHLEARSRYYYDMLKDPATGVIPVDIYEREKAFARQLPQRSRTAGSGDMRIMALNNYLPAGPNNVGGRTRAVAYDVRYGTSNTVILAGSVSGGILRSANGGVTWTLVTPENDVHSFTALAQDPRPGSQDTWYAAGGEAYGNSASNLAGAPYMGYGIWKSTNNGLSWTKLTFAFTDISGNPAQGTSLEAFDHAFDFVHRLAVNPVNGHLYVACHRRLIRSTDGGASFQAVFGSPVGANAANGQTEVIISNSGRILLGVNGGIPDQALRGVWVSTSGGQGSFTRIAGGTVLNTDSVAEWRGNDRGQASRRIVMSYAPSNQNIAYVFYENGLSSDAPELKPEADLFRLDISGNSYSWSNRSANMPDFPGGNLSGSDPIALQGGYNMIVAVQPDNPDVVFVGGTNLYRSNDGFTTSNTTSWINGYNTNFTYALYPNGHPDQHYLVFNPVNPNEAIAANDGGLQRTTDISTATVSWTMLPNYQTLQYYYVAMDPGAGRNNFVGGSQDNGTHFRDKLNILPNSTPADSNNHVRLLGGDGTSVGISRIDLANQNQFLYGGSQYGNIQRVRLTNGLAFNNIRPNGLTLAFPGADNEFGEFVTNFRLNTDNTEQLYYVNFNRLFRTTAASSVTAGGWTELTGISSALDPSNGRTLAIRAIAFSRGAYQTNHALYIGTTNGRILRLDDPQNAAAATAPVDITPSALTGNVQDIAVNPNNDDEIMAVVSNYNVTSIWWTANAKSATPTWRNAEGNLTLPSVRSCAIVVKKDAANNPVTEYYVGTSVGLYSTADLATIFGGSGSPVWQREGGTVLNYAVVQSLAYRPVDNVMVVGTHGNGMYYTYLGTPNFTPSQNTGVPITNARSFIRAVYPTLASGSDVQYQIGQQTGIRSIRVQLHDMSGRLAYSKQVGYTNGSIPLGGLPSGNYIISIYSDNNKYRHIQKIVKQ